VPLFDPLPPQYFLRVVSDRWLHGETVVPISFRHLLLPDRYPPPTELLDLKPLPIKALHPRKDFAALYEHRFPHFNTIQTQTFKELYETDNNVLLCAPPGSGKTACAEFGVLRFLASRPEGAKCVYIAPRQEIVSKMHADWEGRLGAGEGGLGLAAIGLLVGEGAVDLKTLERSDITMCTAEQWDMISRRWKQRRAVQAVTLCVVDEIHLLGGVHGPALEVVVSRMRYMSAQLERPIRIIAFGASIANAAVLGEWMGTGAGGCFNFHPTARPCPLELQIQSFDVNNFSARLLAMGKPCYNAICSSAALGKQKAIVFVPSRKQAQFTAIDMLTYAAADGDAQRFLGDGQAVAALAEGAVRSPALKHTLKFGVGFCDSGMREAERRAVQRLFREGAIRVLVATHDLCWGLDAGQGGAAAVLVLDTQFYDGREHRYARSLARSLATTSTFLSSTDSLTPPLLVSLSLLYYLFVKGTWTTPFPTCCR